MASSSALLAHERGSASSSSTDPTMLMALRVAPFVVAAGLVFSRRTHTFHVEYLRATLRRPMRQHQPRQLRSAVANPVLEKWLKSALSGRQKRVLHVVAGDSLLGKSSTTLHHVSERQGIMLDLFAAQHPKDVRMIMQRSIVAQSAPLSRFVAPLGLDLRTTLPVAVRPSLWDRMWRPWRPVIIVRSAERIFLRGEDGDDAAWLLWVLLEASRHAECVLLCSDEAALQQLLPMQPLAPFIEVIFCPEPPDRSVAAAYASRLDTKSWPDAEQRFRLGLRIAELFRRAPQLANDMLRIMALYRADHDGDPREAAEVQAEVVLDEAAASIAHRLSLSTPSAFMTPQEAEKPLLVLECALRFAVLHPETNAYSTEFLQPHDEAVRQLMTHGLLRVETSPDGRRALRSVQDAAVIWALSSPGPRNAALALIALLKRKKQHHEDNTVCDQGRLDRLCTSLHSLLAAATAARPILQTWIATNMIANGDVNAAPSVDWRRLVEALSDE